MVNFEQKMTLHLILKLILHIIISTFLTIVSNSNYWVVFPPPPFSVFITCSSLCFHSGSWGVVSLWDSQRETDSPGPHPLIPSLPFSHKDMHSKNRKFELLSSPTFFPRGLVISPPLRFFVSQHPFTCVFWSDLGQKVFMIVSLVWTSHNNRLVEFITQGHFRWCQASC